MASLTVNGSPHEVVLDPDRSLLLVLRVALGLTGAKVGCLEGECGACTVLVGGVAVQACKTSVRDAVGSEVTTIEGLAAGGVLHPVQQAFLDHAALQCGYCTPGMILGAVALLRANPDPTDAEIREGMEGHVCRCCTYPRIVDAIRDAATRMGGAR